MTPQINTLVNLSILPERGDNSLAIHDRGRPLRFEAPTRSVPPTLDDGAARHHTRAPESESDEEGLVELLG